MAFDSRAQTWQHIHTVRSFLGQIITDLHRRAHEHDQSKLVAPERAVFDRFTPLLAETTYGSDEYKTHLAGMVDGLRHHYSVNDHHPEHFAFGIDDMNLLQVIEMLADWKAATMRHSDGDLRTSIDINAERFGCDPQLKGLLVHTARDLGWL